MKSINILVITVLVVTLFSCSKNQKLDEEDFIKEMNLSAHKDVLIADEFDKTLITLTLPQDATDSSVTMTTSSGEFSNSANTQTMSTKLIELNGELVRQCQTFLTSSRAEGDVYVRAQFMDFSKQIKLQFGRAYPDRIHINVDSLSTMHGTDVFNFSSQITRVNGKPSLQSIIYTTAEDADTTGKFVGNFLGASWKQVNDTGLVDFDFVLGQDSCHCKKVKLSTYTIRQNKDTIKDFKLINVK